MPAVIAVCPNCSNGAPVPEEATGKKVKCKKCATIFVVEPVPAGKLEKPGSSPGSNARSNSGSKSGVRPKTNAPARPKTHVAGAGRKRIARDVSREPNA